MFAYQQWKTASLQADIALSKLKYDTFAARHDVSQAAYDLIKYVLSKTYRSDQIEYLRECKSRIEQARFYFPEEIVFELNVIVIKVGRLETDYIRESNANFLQRKSLSDRIDSLENELATRAVDLPRLFEPYLSIGLLKKPEDKRRSFSFVGTMLPILIFFEMLIIIVLLTVAVGTSKMG